MTPVIRQIGELRLLNSTTACHQVHGKLLSADYQGWGVRP